MSDSGSGREANPPRPSGAPEPAGRGFGPHPGLAFDEHGAPFDCEHGDVFRSRHGAWQEAGAKDALERATEIWQQALREYEQPTMDPAIREELDAYIARRKEEIGSGEP